MSILRSVDTGICLFVTSLLLLLQKECTHSSKLLDKSSLNQGFVRKLLSQIDSPVLGELSCSVVRVLKCLDWKFGVKY